MRQTFIRVVPGWHIL